MFLGVATLHKWINDSHEKCMLKCFKITAILWTFEVQEQLGHLDIKSVACMINEFFTCGDNFTAVASKLWPFKFASPRSGYLGKKRIPFVDGDSFGNQILLSIGNYSYHHRNVSIFFFSKFSLFFSCLFTLMDCCKSTKAVFLKRHCWFLKTVFFEECFRCF